MGVVLLGPGGFVGALGLAKENHWQRIHRGRGNDSLPGVTWRRRPRAGVFFSSGGENGMAGWGN